MFLILLNYPKESYVSKSSIINPSMLVNKLPQCHKNFINYWEFAMKILTLDGKKKF